MRLLENIDEQDLNILEGLPDILAYKVLQKVRKNIVSGMKEEAFKTIHITEDQRLAHARQLGHIDAWKLDDGMPDLARKEQEFRRIKKKV